jgi:hypothetical protein
MSVCHVTYGAHYNEAAFEGPVLLLKIETELGVMNHAPIVAIPDASNDKDGEFVFEDGVYRLAVDEIALAIDAHRGPREKDDSWPSLGRPRSAVPKCWRIVLGPLGPDLWGISERSRLSDNDRVKAWRGPEIPDWEEGGKTPLRIGHEGNAGLRRGYTDPGSTRHITGIKLLPRNPEEENSCEGKDAVEEDVTFLQARVFRWSWFIVGAVLLFVGQWLVLMAASGWQ